jgi:hypothetical protein
VSRRLPGLLALSFAAVLLPACTPSAVLMTPPPTVTPPPGQGEETTGQVTFSAGGLGTAIAYGPWRVSGPGIELRYAGDGAWTGQIAGADVRLQAQAGLVTGPGIRLDLVQDGSSLAIRGTWTGHRVDLTVGRLGLVGTLEKGGCDIQLRPVETGIFGGPLGCPARPAGAATSSEGTLRLAGEALLVPDVLLPQFVLALLAALPT